MRNARNLVSVSCLALILILGAAAARAAAPDKAAPAPGKIRKKTAAAAHVMLNPGDLKWGPAPPGLPPGSQVALVEGNPAAPGRYTVRMKAGDGYRVPAHWHPTDESLTVLSGTVLLATGDALDESKAMSLTTGAFASMPPKMKHALWCRTDTEIQISGTGPFQITYVNPADDPRKAAPATPAQ